MKKERLIFDGRNIDGNTALKGAIADISGMRHSGVGNMKTVPQRDDVRTVTVLRSISGDNEVGTGFVAGQQGVGDIAWR